MLPEYSAETTVTESALLKRVTDHWRPGLHMADGTPVHVERDR
jgi:hypothetical protein